MSLSTAADASLLIFPDADKSPLSIRAKALVFIDPRTRQLREEVERLAGLPVPVLIQGETGTGKELLARHIHRASERPGLFVTLSCSSLSPNHGEAELFGYTAGAHQGAPSSRAGWLGSANGGTLYLDEIADLPLALQAQLLAVLETGEVWRVGAAAPTPVEVRLVAASSIDLWRAVAAGKFDERLAHYLSDGRLELPPLRERVGDVLPLAEYFLGIYAQRLRLPLPGISLAAQALLERHDWPGNTRELENVVHFALLVCDGDELDARHLNLPAAPPLKRVEHALQQLLDEGDTQQLASLRELLRRVEQRIAV
ncbi:sigma-54 interacting transcriptional regulator [Pseudomonas sp. URMO17WK12:I1]|uniref:sigma 54-interacting transcriptional regulator n=1 Tax=unclassified Pseudomonas TaxID=196821 RepID=UPI00047F6F27|nr:MULTISPECIES: sigma 54-interacting transcriptional regulator [unclassified Pseudomonas]PZW65737.1 sigma-54 interacting transcriptional regulator [Pseudomonas sp. URMO17WK12:I1]